MSALVMISGSIFRGPETRPTKNGSTFITLVVKIANGNASEFWRVAVFDRDAQAELDGLEQGDGVAFVGRPTFEVYEKDGDHRVSLSLAAEKAQSLKKVRKRDGFTDGKWARTA